MEVLREKLASYSHHGFLSSPLLRPGMVARRYCRGLSALVRQVLCADVQGCGWRRCAVRDPHGRPACLEEEATKMRLLNNGILSRCTAYVVHLLELFCFIQ